MLNLELINSAEKIVVALSGGADSVALLHMLSTQKNIQVFACHLNHKTRGDESKRDLDFSKKLCERLKIPFYYEEIDVVVDKKIGFEATARKIRYDFYDRSVKHFEADKIATGHNCDDNLETLLLNVIRGTGIDGLCGIPLQRENIIRPILHITREEIEQYLNDKNVDFIIDSSNNTDDYARNKIRHHCIPKLKEINENAVKNAYATTKTVSKYNQFIDSEVNELYTKMVSSSANEYSINTQQAKLIDQAILFKIIKKIAKNLNSPLSNSTFNEISLLIHSKNPSAKLEKDFLINREYDTIKFSEFSKKEQCQMIVNSNDITITTNMLDNLDVCYYISKCKIDFETLVLRKRKTGDKIKTKSGTKTLKKAFIDMKIPQNKRDYIPILEDKNGIISVCYLDINQDIDSKTKEFKIIFRSMKNEK